MSMCSVYVICYSYSYCLRKIEGGSVTKFCKLKINFGIFRGGGGGGGGGVYHQLPPPHLAFNRGKPKISFLFHFKKEGAGTLLDLWI